MQHQRTLSTLTLTPAPSPSPNLSLFSQNNSNNIFKVLSKSSLFNNNKQKFLQHDQQQQQQPFQQSQRLNFNNNNHNSINNCSVFYTNINNKRIFTHHQLLTSIFIKLKNKKPKTNPNMENERQERKDRERVDKNLNFFYQICEYRKQIFDLWQRKGCHGCVAKEVEFIEVMILGVWFSNPLIFACLLFEQGVIQCNLYVYVMVFLGMCFILG